MMIDNCLINFRFTHFLECCFPSNGCKIKAKNTHNKHTHTHTQKEQITTLMQLETFNFQFSKSCSSQGRRRWIMVFWLLGSCLQICIWSYFHAHIMFRCPHWKNTFWILKNIVLKIIVSTKCSFLTHLVIASFDVFINNLFWWFLI
jgi:hypothetical protein